MEGYLERIELLVGKDGIKKLSELTVMVVGVGGVGSYAAEALARCGIGTLILVDADTVATSNLNRQLHATFETIGKSKTQVMKERILTYRKDCTIHCHSIFYDANKNEELFAYKVDAVIDAIDTMSAKADLIQTCLEKKILFISSMGMANRWDPTKVTVCDLMKTSYDPVAKIMRNIVRKRKLRGKIPVVYSSEQPFVQTQIINENGKTRKEKMPPASTPFVPSAAGIACASFIVRKFLADLIK